MSFWWFSLLNSKANDSVVVTGSTPVITLIGGEQTVVQNSVYATLGATAFDEEDGDITQNIVRTDTIDLTTIGTYEERYNVINSKRVSAVEVVRIVNVVAEGTNAFPYIFPIQLQ